MARISIYLDDDLYQRVVVEADGKNISAVIQESLRQTLPPLPICPCCGQDLLPGQEAYENNGS